MGLIGVAVGMKVGEAIYKTFDKVDKGYNKTKKKYNKVVTKGAKIKKYGKKYSPLNTKSDFYKNSPFYRLQFNKTKW